MNYNLLFNRLVIALAFIIPLSIAGYNLILAALTLTWVVEAKWKEKWEIIKVQPVFKAMLIYFIFLVFSLFWTENLSSGIHYVKQYYIFLLLPILYTSIDRSRIPQFFSAFLAAMIISEIISYLIYFNLMPFQFKPTWSSSDPSPFMMHSIYSLFLVFSIFLMFARLTYEHRTKFQTFFYTLFIITMTINLFINSGRTGQFTFLLAILVFVYLHYRLHWLKALLLGIPVLSIIFTIAFFGSPNFKNRTIETFKSIEYTLEKNEACNDSTGQRIMMWQVASQIIFEHPVLGVGIGDERDSYNSTLINDLPELHPYINTFSDMHNTYLKVFVATGAIGLLLFLWIFYLFFKELSLSEELHSVGGVLLIILLQYMFIGNLPAAHLTIMFLLMLSITLRHPQIKHLNHFNRSPS